MQGIQQKDKDDPVLLLVGTQVSAKYKGAFCEAKIHTISKDLKVRVTYKKGGQQTVSDDQIIGELRVGSVVDIKSNDSKVENGEATITKIQDCSKYTVVFDDGDIATLRRSALCRQSGKHFNACDTLDQLPLTHPEQRGGGKRTKTQDEYESDDDEYAIGKVICVENTDTKKKNAKESYFPALIVAPKAQENVKIHIKSEYLVRSFKDGKFYTVPKKEVFEFSKETEQKSDTAAVAAAREFLDKNVLPTHWDREVLIDSASLSDQELSDSSDDEPNEVKDRFFAQLLEFMEKRNSPLNKGPSITNRDVDLYRLYYSVEKLGGYANVTKIRNWKAIAKRLGFTPTDAIVKLVKHSYRKFLLAFEEAVTKGIEELPPRTNRDKARSSSTRSGSVASPKVSESKPSKKMEKIPPTAGSSTADDSAENTNESTKITLATSRKLSTASSKAKTSTVVSASPVVVVKTEKEEKIKIEKEEDTPSTSPVATPASSAKKEKLPKKKQPESKKSIKKEEPTEKKEIVISKSQAPSGPSIADDVPIEIDDRLKVYYRGSSDYEAKVLEISEQDGKSIYRVHYKGWNARYDEWIHRESIAENLSKDEVKKKIPPSKSSSSTSTNQPSTPSSATQKGTGKRGRNRADTTASSRSTTPLSNTSSKTKTTTAKRPTRGTPTSKNRPSKADEDSSESDEPIKKLAEKKDKSDEKSMQKLSDNLADTKPSIKDMKSDIKVEKAEPSKSDDEKSTKSSIKSFDVKGKLKQPIQRDSSRSSFHSTDSDSSHSVPSDVPNSSKSAYTSENEANEPEKIVKPTTTDAKKSSFKFDEETSDTKNPPVASFFGEKAWSAASEKLTSDVKTAEIAVVKKPTNIFQEKKSAAQKAAIQETPNRSIGRFAQLEKSFTSKDGGKISSAAKTKETLKTEDKLAAESDIYEFNDIEDTPLAASVVKKQESPSETQSKKQQLAQQQRKQARAAAQQKEEPSEMEDIETLIKKSIVSMPMNKKPKKSPIKEDKTQSRTSVQSQQPITTTVAPISSSSSTSWDLYSKSPIATPNRKSESTFDVLRKSPSFNMHHGTDDFSSPSLASTATTTTTPGKSQSFSSLTSSAPLKFGSSIPTNIDTHELLKPVMMPSKEEEKPELEAFKRILDPSFDILPKQEKQTLSVTDKLLKAFSQVESSAMEAKKEESFPKLAPATSQKLSSSKKDHLDIVNPVESAVSSSTTTLETGVVKKPADDSDTDSDRLVIEDEDAPPTDEKRKMGVLESIMLQDDVPYKHKDSDKKYSESGEQQSETMSLLLCEETIPGSPAPASVKDPLSEIGRSPTSSGNFIQPQPQGKAISTDMDGDVELATGDILRDKLKSMDRGSATSSGKNTNNNSENSNDDQSGSERNSKSDITPRKRKRPMKVEADSHQKRRRHQRTGVNVRGINLHGADSDSNDNSDINPYSSSTRSQIETGEGSNNKIKYNFLVELDPNLSSSQCINILETKIRDLRKTYLMIKNEMNAKERRWKRLRKRERERQISKVP